MTGVGGGVIVNWFDVAPTRLDDVNVIVRAPATPAIPRSVNVATPPLVATARVPDKLPPPLASAAVIVADAVDTRLPAASRISTTGCVASGPPIAPPSGC